MIWGHLDTLWLFLPAALAVNLTPGPNLLYCATRGSSQGPRAGLLSALAISVGHLVHIAFAALGLSALLLHSAQAFTIIKIIGAAYLVYLGLRTLRQARRPLPPSRLSPAPLAKVFGQGFLVNLLNPKVALFFLSFLPQFVDPAAGSVAGQIIVLGLIFVVTSTMINSAVGLGFGLSGRWLLGQRARRVQGYVSGGVYLAMGLGLALAQRR